MRGSFGQYGLAAGFLAIQRLPIAAGGAVPNLSIKEPGYFALADSV
jgi:hypothetical protein